MRKFLFFISLLLLALLAGCQAYSGRQVRTNEILACPSFPCGNRMVYDDLELAYEFRMLPTDECVLEGTAMLRGAAASKQVDLAVLSVELIRDDTVAQSLSFPMESGAPGQPLRFIHRFTPDGGFDGATFHWDIRFVSTP